MLVWFVIDKITQHENRGLWVRHSSPYENGWLSQQFYFLRFTLLSKSVTHDSEKIKNCRLWEEANSFNSLLELTHTTSIKRFTCKANLTKFAIIMRLTYMKRLTNSGEYVPGWRIMWFKIKWAEPRYSNEIGSHDFEMRVCKPWLISAFRDKIKSNNFDTMVYEQNQAYSFHGGCGLSLLPSKQIQGQFPLDTMSWGFWVNH